jgi:hypothetical protein
MTTVRWGSTFWVLFLAVHALCLINFCQTVDQRTHGWNALILNSRNFPTGVPGPGPGQVRVHHEIHLK